MATQNSINSQDPIQVALGGTSLSAVATAYAPLCGGTTTTGAIQSADTGISTSGFVLTSTGSASLPTFQAAPTATGAMVLLNTQTASSSASLTFTSTYITSTYNRYLVVFSNLIPATGSTQFLMDMSVDNGSNYLGSNYVCGINIFPYNSATPANTNSTSTCPMTSATGVDTGVGIVGGELWLFGLATVAGVPTYSGQINYATHTGTLMGYNQGSVNVNNLRFTMSSGNLNSGTISLYGIAQ